MRWTNERIEQRFNAIFAECKRAGLSINATLFKCTELSYVIAQDASEELNRLRAELAEAKELLWLRDSTHPMVQDLNEAENEDEDGLICFVCDKPITYEQMDDRHWCHEEGCIHDADIENWEGCNCDLECHAECCPDCKHEAPRTWQLASE